MVKKKGAPAKGLGTATCVQLFEPDTIAINKLSAVSGKSKGEIMRKAVQFALKKAKEWAL